MRLPELQFPWEYLRSASQSSLQSFELSRLNHAAHLRKEISALLDQWLEDTASALLARWLFDHRNQLASRHSASASPSEATDPFRDSTAAARVRKHRGRDAAD